MSNPGYAPFNPPWEPRDADAFLAFKAQQDLARRRKEGKLNKEEFIRARDEMRQKRFEADSAAKKAYRNRVDNINRKKQILRAKKQQEQYHIRMANEAIDKANAAKSMKCDLEAEIAALEGLDIDFPMSQAEQLERQAQRDADAEYAQYHGTHH